MSGIDKLAVARNIDKDKETELCQTIIDACESLVNIAQDRYDGDYEEYWSKLSGMALSGPSSATKQQGWIKTMEAYQIRAVEEKAALDDRIEKLAAFVGTERFCALPEAEQIRMTRQLAIMRDYSGILGERIAIEVIFGGSVYALGIETALDLLAGLEMATRLPPAAVALRDDLRRAIGRRSRTANERSDTRRAPRCLSRLVGQ